MSDENIIPLRGSEEQSKIIDDLRKRVEGGSSGDGGGGGGNSNVERLSRLETHLDHLRRDLTEIRSSLDVLPSLATRRDLETWRGQWLAIGIGIVALVVGGIVGGLALINHYAASGSVAAPAPILIQVPAPGPSATSTPPTNDKSIPH